MRCARTVVAIHQVLVEQFIASFAEPPFIVTNLNGDAQQLYDQVYCARGEMENRIKDASN